MKILTVADAISEQLLDDDRDSPLLAGIDLILSCGDLPPEYLTTLRARFDAPLYYVLGNHDLRYNQAPPVGCRYIHRRFVEHDGIRIAGFSGSRWYNGNLNQFTEREMARFARRMRFSLWRHGGVDVILTHTPPRYINDREDLCHRGFHVFRRLIEKYQPRFFIHGHIHQLFADDSERVSVLGTTQVINCYGYHIFKI